MRVTISTTREYEMDEKKILGEVDFVPPNKDASIYKIRAWLRDSFFELCGEGRDEDHIDGTYIKLMYEDGDADFDWPKGR